MSALPAHPTFENLTCEMVAKTIDHAVLKPQQTIADLKKNCEVCRKYNTYSVCCKPNDVTYCYDFLKGSDVKVAAVVSFPAGNSRTSTKVAEAVQAIKDGAHDVDMVINIGHLKSGLYDDVRNDMKEVVVACKNIKPDCTVKAILEMADLDEDEKIRACRLAEDAGVDFVKTSTGFAASGAKIPDLKLMRANCTSKVAVKASGGIHDLDYLIECLQAGATRIGCSGTEKIIEEMKARKAAA